MENFRAVTMKIYWKLQNLLYDDHLLGINDTEWLLKYLNDPHTNIFHYYLFHIQNYYFIESLWIGCWIGTHRECYCYFRNKSIYLMMIRCEMHTSFIRDTHNKYVDIILISIFILFPFIIIIFIISRYCIALTKKLNTRGDWGPIIIKIFCIQVTTRL